MRNSKKLPLKFFVENYARNIDKDWTKRQRKKRNEKNKNHINKYEKKGNGLKQVHGRVAVATGFDKIV